MMEVGGQHDDAGIPAVTIDAEVHAPLLHLLVVNHVRSPHVAVNAPVWIGCARPLKRVECRHVDICATFLYLGDFGFYEGNVVANASDAISTPGHCYSCPCHQVG